MDLALHLRVIWRFRYLVAVGLILACCLAVFALARPELKNGKPRLVYRQSEIWAGYEKLLITQSGVPWGRLALGTSASGAGTSSSGTSQYQVFADPGRLSSLAPFYAQLANSEAVQQYLPRGAVKATPVVDTSTPYASALPILQFTAVAKSPKRADELAVSAAMIFRNYVMKQQAAADIPTSQRVLLQPLNDAAGPQLAQPRKKSLAILAFATILVATLGLAFILENLRPRVAVPADVAVDASTVAKVADDHGAVDEPLARAQHGG